MPLSEHGRIISTILLVVVPTTSLCLDPFPDRASFPGTGLFPARPDR